MYKITARYDPGFFVIHAPRHIYETFTEEAIGGEPYCEFSSIVCSFPNHIALFSRKCNSALDKISFE